MSDDEPSYHNSDFRLEAYYYDDPSEKERPVSVHLPSDVMLPISVARDFARGLLKAADAAERAQIGTPNGSEDKSPNMLLNVEDEGGQSIIGLNPHLIDTTLTFIFNGRRETATLVRAQSFCDLDSDNKPRKLTITLDVQS